jgi:DNA polymerase elongation subunit (family B)
MEMIDVFSSANNSREFMQKIPQAFDVVKDYRQKLLDGDVPIGDLIISKHLSKNPKHYKQHVSQVIAAEQLIKEGSEVHAGNNVKFVFTHSEDKRFERRVKAAQLIVEGTNPDTKRYLSLLYASAANLLSFAGYTTQSIYEAVVGQNQNYLLGYCKSTSLPKD